MIACVVRGGAQVEGAAESLRHVAKRLKDLAASRGLYADKYLVLSLVEGAIVGLLPRLPGFLPVVQTTVRVPESLGVTK